MRSPGIGEATEKASKTCGAVVRILFVGPRQTEIVSIIGASSAITTSSQSFSQKRRKMKPTSAAATSLGIEAASFAPLR